MDWSWAVEGITEETPRTTGPECINYMTDRRRWVESVFFTILFIFITRRAMKRLVPIVVPQPAELERPHSATRLFLLIAMTLIFGIEIGFKLSGKSMLFLLNPCHIQTVVQIYLLAAKPSKTTIALFRIQMNNLNGPFLAFLFPEVEFRTFPFEQTTYWIQHALLYIIPVYILRSDAYSMEEFTDYNWVTIGVMIMLLYHFTVLNALSIFTGINLNHMLCAAVADPFQGQHYRIAAVIHESILCPILNKMTVLIFSRNRNKQTSLKTKQMPLETRHMPRSNQADYDENARLYHQQRDHTPLMPMEEQELSLSEMSLAAEIAAAMGESMPMLTHRRNADRAPSTTAEYGYTMPTTKID